MNIQEEIIDPMYEKLNRYKELKFLISKDEIKEFYDFLIKSNENN